MSSKRKVQQYVLGYLIYNSFKLVSSVSVPNVLNFAVNIHSKWWEIVYNLAVQLD